MLPAAASGPRHRRISMNARQRAQLESFRRVHTFMERHASLAEEQRYSRARVALDVTIERLEALESEFDLLMFRSRVVILRKRFAEESLHADHVVPLVELARAISVLESRIPAAPESCARRKGA